MSKLGFWLNGFLGTHQQDHQVPSFNNQITNLPVNIDTYKGVGSL